MAASATEENIREVSAVDSRDGRAPAGPAGGGVEIIVPPDLAVETEGTGILGGFEAIDRSPPEPDPERPILRIRGTAVMGGVSVETRLLGEGERDARRRRRRERRERRALADGRGRKELPAHDDAD